MKKILLASVLALCGSTLFAQTVTQVTGISIWEHHSSAINGGTPFGGGANGSMSGYDFMNHTYQWSFDSASFGPHPAAQLVNIDLVEHNSQFGNGGDFGFTSGESSIWNGDINGNGTTKYFPAPASFNYDTVTNVASIRNAYDSVAATISVDTVIQGTTYLARIRNTNRYVAMKVTNVTNLSPNHSSGDTASIHFTFNYKWGNWIAQPSSVHTVAAGAVTDVVLSPVPNKSSFTVKATVGNGANNATVRITDVTGREVCQQTAIVKSGSIAAAVVMPTSIASGLYLLQLSCGDGVANSTFYVD